MGTKLSFGFIALLLLGVCGCGLEELGVGRFTRDFHYSYALKAGGRISIETFNGAVEITGWDQEVVEIDGAKLGPSPEAADALRIDVNALSDNIAIRATRPGDFRNFGSRGVRFSMKVPRKTILERIATSNGPIAVQGVFGPAHLRTSNGPIRVGNFDNNLEAHTSNGAIELTDVGGDAVVTTSNGHIRVDNVRGALEATTSNSSITARMTGSRVSHSLRLETTNGPVDLTLPAGFTSGARVTSSNGSIVLHLPSDLNAHVLARTNNAAITSQFEMKVEGVISKNHLDAVIGNGGPLLDLATSNGGIRLLRM